jgi:hypothetical protein
MPAGWAILNFFTVCWGLAGKRRAAAGGQLLVYTAFRLPIVQCTNRGQLNIKRAAPAKHYGRMSAAAGADCQSPPTLGLAGNTSDLITTGTAPEVSRMAPMSM